MFLHVFCCNIFLIIMNINNTCEGFIVDKKLIIFTLALILCYFGLFAGWLNILSWEIKIFNFIFLLKFFFMYFILVVMLFIFGCCKKYYKD